MMTTSSSDGAAPPSSLVPVMFGNLADAAGISLWLWRAKNTIATVSVGRGGVMRSFVGLMIIHGLIHFMGFAKAFGLGELAQLTQHSRNLSRNPWASRG